MVQVDGNSKNPQIDIPSGPFSGPAQGSGGVFVKHNPFGHPDQDYPHPVSGKKGTFRSRHQLKCPFRTSPPSVPEPKLLPVGTRPRNKRKKGNPEARVAEAVSKGV